MYVGWNTDGGVFGVFTSKEAAVVAITDVLLSEGLSEEEIVHCLEDFIIDGPFTLEGDVRR